MNFLRNLLQGKELPAQETSSITLKDSQLSCHYNKTNANADGAGSETVITSGEIISRTTGYDENKSLLPLEYRHARHLDPGWSVKEMENKEGIMICPVMNVLTPVNPDSVNSLALDSNAECLTNAEQNTNGMSNAGNDNTCMITRNVDDIEQIVLTINSHEPKNIVMDNVSGISIPFCSDEANVDMTAAIVAVAAENCILSINALPKIQTHGIMSDTHELLEVQTHEDDLLCKTDCNSKTENETDSKEDVKEMTEQILPLELLPYNNSIMQKTMNEMSSSPEIERLTSMLMHEANSQDVQEDTDCMTVSVTIKSLEEKVSCTVEISEKIAGPVLCSSFEGEYLSNETSSEILSPETDNKDICSFLPNKLDMEGGISPLLKPPILDGDVNHPLYIRSGSPLEENVVEPEITEENCTRMSPNPIVSNILQMEDNCVSGSKDEVVSFYENSFDYNLEHLEEIDFNPFESRIILRNSPPKCNISLPAVCPTADVNYAENNTRTPIQTKTYECKQMDNKPENYLADASNEVRIDCEACVNIDNQKADSKYDCDEGNEPRLGNNKHADILCVNHNITADNNSSNEYSDSCHSYVSNFVDNNSGTALILVKNYSPADKDDNSVMSTDDLIITQDDKANDLTSINMHENVSNTIIDNNINEPDYPQIGISPYSNLETRGDNKCEITGKSEGLDSLINGIKDLNYSVVDDMEYSCDAIVNNMTESSQQIIGKIPADLSALETSDEHHKMNDIKGDQARLNIDSFQTTASEFQHDSEIVANISGACGDNDEPTVLDKLDSSHEEITTDLKMLDITACNSAFLESKNQLHSCDTTVLDSDELNEVVGIEAANIVHELTLALEEIQLNIADGAAETCDSHKIDITSIANNCSQMNQSEAGPEVATGLTATDLQCASKFFRDAANFDNKFNIQLASSMESQCKLEEDSGVQDSFNSSGENFCPREERSAPEGTSSPDPKSLETSVIKGSIASDSILKGSEVNELLKKQEQRFEAKFLRRSLDLAERENAMHSIFNHDKKDSESTAAALKEATSSRDALLKLVEQYKGMLSTLVTDKERQQRSHLEATKCIQTEKAQALEDLANVEAAFSDVHRKYERTKQIVEALKKNEETLKRGVSEYEDRMQRNEKKFVEMQRQTEQKIAMANEEFEGQQKSNEHELTKMAALLKKAEMKIISLQESLDRKTRENQELTQLCDELISKVGS